MNMNALAKKEIQAKVKKAPLILVVDDVEDNRDILTRRLERRGFEVDEASGGYEALEKIENGKYDLILLDIMMPDINGNEVLPIIRSKYNATELPVIMVSAKSQSDDVVESLNLGANDYVTKPVDISIAVARINNQLEIGQQGRSVLKSKQALEEKTKKMNHAIEEIDSELRDETQRLHVSEEKLHFLAFHDSLTQALNRQGFRDALHQVVNEKTPNMLETALLFIDLDGFKSVNDLHGHEIGDKILCAVFERMKSFVPDEFKIARLGGDEFAIITQFVEQSEPSMKLAEKLVNELGKPFEIHGSFIAIGASCGVARASEFPSDLDALVKGADLAMYHAKSNGRGGAVLFESQMLKDQVETRRLESDLRLAVQNNAFKIFYQPLFNIVDKSITGFEALVRWPHPKRGLISPEVFIPIAEETGLINQLGSWVLREACHEACKWPEEIKIAVNLSPVQFKNPSLMVTLVNALASSGLTPARLELEITEMSLLGSEGVNVRVLNAIHELGVKVSIDDFGTGYSSLTYLKNFRFDKIKIDRRFIQGLDSSVSDSAIVDAIIGLGNSIGIGTTAEGIETEDQLAAVLDRGCDEGQGYLFSRPLTSEDALKFIDKIHADNEEKKK